MKKKFTQVYQFKVTLLGIEPPIWRRIQVPETYTFWDLHVAIQDCMGWHDCHMHEFTMMDPGTSSPLSIGTPYEDAEDILPEEKQNIADYFSMETPVGQYTYDFGDSWEHEIQLEEILPCKDMTYPVCIDGKRAGPPEDSGGSWGYEEFLKIIKDPGHEEYEDMIDWVGGEFDPEHFDVKEVIFDDPARRRKMIFG